ncbi:uncharacterized protein CDAR_594431 [Caerostris darwini]|uniref:Transmembrane protein n=1 Tax=Caerostris darwini TaxID=1538125 RepID=A0AAV4P9C5_9ARAC|nr:uncharacterized protein CDAR_594431 [Caerostris darwini]
MANSTGVIKKSNSSLHHYSARNKLLACREHTTRTHCHVFSRGLINVGNYLGNGKGAILFYANVSLQTMDRPAVGQEDVDVTRTLKRGAFFLFSSCLLPFFVFGFLLTRVLFFLSNNVWIRSRL